MPEQIHTDTDVRARVDELVEQGRALRRYDYDRMRAVAEEAFQLACEQGAHGPVYPYGMAAALALLAHRDCVLGHWSETISEAAQALALLESDTPDLVRGEIFDALGWAHFCMGDYPQALDNLMQALEIAQVIGDRSLEAYVLDSVGNVYSSSPTMVYAAAEAQAKALEIHRELGDELGEALVLNNTTYTFIELGDLDGALDTATEALGYARRESRDYLLVSALDTMTDVRLARGELAAAEETAREAIAVANEAGSMPDRATALLSLARVDFERGNLDDAKRHGLKAAALQLQLGATPELAESHLLLSRISQTSGDFEDALEHFRTYHELYETAATGVTESRLAELRLRYELENARKDAEILRLRSLALEREVEESRLVAAQLEAQASLDALTGLYNRAHLPVLEAELAGALTRGLPVSLMVLDVDRFKEINDAHGHPAGDKVLIEVSRQLTSNARSTDTPLRYGGDEFMLLLAGMDVGDAHAVAERLRSAVSGVRIESGEAMVAATVSIWVATTNLATHTLPELIELADRALYAAKKAGRNRIFIEA